MEEKSGVNMNDAGSELMYLPKRARYEVRCFLAKYPTIYRPLARLKPRTCNGPVVVSEDTDLVLEGFPRSGNTFSYFAIRSCQKRELTIAHHFHAQAQVIFAASRGIPAVVLVREPTDCIVSLMQRELYISAEQGVRNWIKFYRDLLPYKERFLTVDFTNVIEDFGGVVHQVRERFRLPLLPFIHNEENVRRCFDAIEAHNSRISNGGVCEQGVARPSLVREEGRGRALAALKRKNLGVRIEEAQELFKTYKSMCC